MKKTQMRKGGNDYEDELYEDDYYDEEYEEEEYYEEDEVYKERKK